MNSSVCLHIPFESFFTWPLCLWPCGGLFDHSIFGCVGDYLTHFLSRFCGFNRVNGQCEAPLHKWLLTQFFIQTVIFDFDSFANFFSILKNFPAISEILGSI